VLNLASESDPSWLQSALTHLDDILLDHAHCERKAAGAAVNMLFRYPEHGFLQQPISALAREELQHYERVLEELAARDVPFGRQRPSPYGGRLHSLIRAREPEHLLDLLLVRAIIEARSCERFQLLADAILEPRLAELYRGLLASEARHHGMYLELAGQVCPQAVVRERLRELADAEAEILTEPCRLVRLHT
jgi:tRNA-(ms[2]io[6]A)-hydroxylase